MYNNLNILIVYLQSTLYFSRNKWIILNNFQLGNCNGCNLLKIAVFHNFLEYMIQLIILLNLDFLNKISLY